MADQKRDKQDEKPCDCPNCQARLRQNKDDKQGACRADTGSNDQTCKVSNNKQQPSRQDERKEQHHEHGEPQAKSSGPESKDPKKQGKPDQGACQHEAHHAPSGSGAAGITPIVASPAAVAHKHTSHEPLAKQQSSEPEQRAERGQQPIKQSEDEATTKRAEKALKSKAESKTSVEQRARSPRPTDEGARGASDAKTAGGTKRVSEPSGLENDGKPSKQPKQDEQPHEEQQSGQRQSGQQQQQLEEEPLLENQPLECTHACPIHCAQENQSSESIGADREPADSVSGRQLQERADRRNRAQRRRSNRGRRRSTAERRPRARSAPRRRRSSAQRNSRRPR